MIRSGLIILIAIIAVCSCESPNDEAEILSYALEMDEARVEFNSTGRQIHIEFPDHVSSASGLTAEFELSEGATALVSEKVQISGKSANNFEKTFSYKIVAEDESTIKWWEIRSSNNPYTSAWGMGGFQNAPVSNNRAYEWYMDQKNTGIHANNNCGPTTTVMASRWYNPEHSNTPSDARSMYRSEGGWWYTSDIKNYLDYFDIPNHTIALGTNKSLMADAFRRELDQGSVAILCLDMYFVAFQSTNEFRTNKFYTTNTEDWGHFLLIKGYRTVDGELYLEAYDSNTWGKTYKDGSLKGKDRYYHSREVYEATSAWWNYAIIVSGTGRKDLPAGAIEFSSLPVAFGR